MEVEGRVRKVDFDSFPTSNCSSHGETNCGIFFLEGIVDTFRNHINVLLAFVHQTKGCFKGIASIIWQPQIRKIAIDVGQYSIVEEIGLIPSYIGGDALNAYDEIVDNGNAQGVVAHA